MLFLLYFYLAYTFVFSETFYIPLFTEYLFHNTEMRKFKRFDLLSLIKKDIPTEHNFSHDIDEFFDT